MHRDHRVVSTKSFKSCIDKINSLIAWIQRNRKIAPSGAIVKANFGSGTVVADGWINIDGGTFALFAGWPTPLLKVIYRFSECRKWLDEDHYIRQLRQHSYIHHDLEYGFPLANESVDYLYSSHVMEHFYPDTALFLFRDAYRVLKKGGRFRVCVPDLDHAFDLFHRGQKEAALDYFFAQRRNPLSQHRYMYDFELISKYLLEAGFSSIERCSHGQGSVPDAEILDCRPEETLYVEALK